MRPDPNDDRVTEMSRGPCVSRLSRLSGVRTVYACHTPAAVQHGPQRKAGEWTANDSTRLARTVGTSLSRRRAAHVVVAAALTAAAERIGLAEPASDRRGGTDKQR